MRMLQNLKQSFTCFDKMTVLLRSVKSSGIFFQSFVAFSEKLDFKYLRSGVWIRVWTMQDIKQVFPKFMSPRSPKVESTVADFVENPLRFRCDFNNDTSAGGGRHG